MCETHALRVTIQRFLLLKISSRMEILWLFVRTSVLLKHGYGYNTIRIRGFTGDSLAGSAVVALALLPPFARTIKSKSIPMDTCKKFKCLISASFKSALFDHFELRNVAMLRAVVKVYLAVIGGKHRMHINILMPVLNHSCFQVMAYTMAMRIGSQGRERR
ncbi:hypothetical protein RHMOL_Rhmol06G0087300 [Rhododendron molle]|uniref:Uncharacterized protein n=1 Tax=Rhododendron molle TaxID=49168 RepID=A0ACC0NC98_RHOML|nr:hypothetical protein RHMOL_Rhmol06G0087300 [Rhododendron molle]